jgi:Fe2+ transport system protein FeoA
MSVSEESSMWPNRQMPLTRLAAGQSAVIVRVTGGAGVKQRLRLRGLEEGVRVRKVSRIGKLGPVIVIANHTQVAVGSVMARAVIVKPSL